MPHILLRFMAIKDKNKIKTSRRIASVWVVISMAIAIFIGFIGNALSKSGKLEALDGSNSEKVIIKISQYMSEHHAGLAVIAGLYSQVSSPAPCPPLTHSSLQLPPQCRRTYSRAYSM